MNRLLNGHKHRIWITNCFDNQRCASAVSLRHRPIQERLGGLSQVSILAGLNHSDDLETGLTFHCKRYALANGVAVGEAAARHLLIDYHHAWRCVAVSCIELPPLKHGNAQGLKIPWPDYRQACRRAGLAL